MLVGYARVSSAGQSLDIQKEQLAAAGCERIFEEKKSGRKASDRASLQDALAFVREGDTLMVTRLDRLARSIIDLRQIADGLAAKGVGLRALQQAEFDTSTSTGKAVIGLLGVMAEFENDLRRERQQEGIEKAKAEGRHLGRPKGLGKGGKVDEATVRAALKAGESPSAVAQRLEIARSSVYRVRDAMS
jgi:DNA invertase Pin-like site-specific DNA recombinase